MDRRYRMTAAPLCPTCGTEALAESPRVARGCDTRAQLRASMVLNLTAAGENGEAIAAATGLVEAAETSQNPFAISFALLAYGFAYRDVKPLRAIDALRRGLAIAHDNGVRAMESFTAMTLGPLEVEHGDSMTALDYVTRTIRNYSDAGNTAVIRLPLACLATVLDRIGRYEAAATVAGFTADPLTSAIFPEIDHAIAHLREVLGDHTYEALAVKGEAMKTSAMAAYAYDQIDRAREELNAV